MVERSVRNAKVRGSTPLGSTISTMYSLTGKRLKPATRAGNQEGNGSEVWDESQVEDLRERVLQSLEQQGFKVGLDRISPPEGGKDEIRCLHSLAVNHKRQRAEQSLRRYESELLSLVASGDEVVPERIDPRLEVVRPDSIESRFFRYASLHWSIPVSPGYGRRLRYVAYDDSNGKVIGLFGLGDPVYNLGARDKWIGWDAEARAQRLRNVMDLYVLGAIPPYSQLLCGKLLALLATSAEVQREFRRKYRGSVSKIARKPFDGRLALLTTTSALGRSSLYNRLRHSGRKVFERLGYTIGTGEFHLSDGVYKDLRQLAVDNSEATAKHRDWGSGFRNKREIVRKSLSLLGLPSSYTMHGVKREVFAAPLAENAHRFLRGENIEMRGRHAVPAGELFAGFRERWLLPRSERRTEYRKYESSEYGIWNSR